MDIRIKYIFLIVFIFSSAFSQKKEIKRMLKMKIQLFIINLSGEI